MNISPDALHAFSLAADCGSLSAAARRLNKSQSTISEAVARLEADLGLELFIRGPRQLTLTRAGQHLLGQAQQVLAAHDRLNRQALQLAHGHEVRLTLVLSDAYQAHQYRSRLEELDQAHPELELECLIAEQADVIDLIQQGRAQIGLLTAQPHYPSDIARDALATNAVFSLYASREHELAGVASISQQQLNQCRALRLKSVTTGEQAHDLIGQHSGPQWSAPDYLMLMEMAELGFGWTCLPRKLVESHGNGQLVELNASGWPRPVQIDAIWSRQRSLGPIAAWLLNRLLDSA